MGTSRFGHQLPRLLERSGGAGARTRGRGLLHLADQPRDRLPRRLERRRGDIQILLLLLDGLQEPVDLALSVHLELQAVISILTSRWIGTV